MIWRRVGLAGGLWVLALAAACGGKQNPDVGGEVFCASYENNYLGACRQNCENDATAGDVDAVKQCGVYCKEQLAKDDTFKDECGK